MGTLPRHPDGTIEGPQGPDYDDVQGFEAEHHVRIPVKIDHPVTVRHLPAVDGQSKTVTISTTGDGVKILNKNPLRGRVILLSDGDYFLGFTKGEVESATSGHIPAGQQVTLTNCAQLWVAARGTSSGTYVTAIAEFWTN